MKVMLEVQPTAIIHLAGLQIPTCKANPVLGARVNVIGTINVFEAAKVQSITEKSIIRMRGGMSSLSICICLIVHMHTHTHTLSLSISLSQSPPSSSFSPPSPSLPPPPLPLHSVSYIYPFPSSGSEGADRKGPNSGVCIFGRYSWPAQ